MEGAWCSVIVQAIPLFKDVRNPSLQDKEKDGRTTGLDKHALRGGNHVAEYLVERKTPPPGGFRRTNGSELFADLGTWEVASSKTWLEMPFFSPYSFFSFLALEDRDRSESYGLHTNHSNKMNCQCSNGLCLSHE